MRWLRDKLLSRTKLYANNVLTPMCKNAVEMTWSVVAIPTVTVERGTVDTEKERDSFVFGVSLVTEQGQKLFPTWTVGFDLASSLSVFEMYLAIIELGSIKTEETIGGVISELRLGEDEENERIPPLSALRVDL